MIAYKPITLKKKKKKKWDWNVNYEHYINPNHGIS
jgi:hypothetical protein